MRSWILVSQMRSFLFNRDNWEHTTMLQLAMRNTGFMAYHADSDKLKYIMLSRWGNVQIFALSNSGNFRD